MIELVRTAATDGLRLDGAVWPAGRSAVNSPPLSASAAIFLHGVGGNFYGGSLFNPLMGLLAEHGVSSYRVNTRGHDGMFAADTAMGRRRFGAACEIVDECRLDIAAWLNHAQRSGHDRVILIGHSLGAIKAAYAAAHEPDSRVAAIVLMSPPRLSYAEFVAGPQRDQFLDSMRRAEQLVADGNGDQLLTVNFPVNLVISGKAFADKYGPEERYNITRFLPKIQPPTLLLYGQREIESDNSAFADLPHVLGQLPNLPSGLKLHTVEDADHFYSGVRDAAAATIQAWLRETLGAD